MSLVAVLAAAVALLAPPFIAFRVFQTQCYTRMVAPIDTPPNYGLTSNTLRRVAPTGVEAAAAILSLHQSRGEPLVLLNGSGMHGWAAANRDNGFWNLSCMRQRFGRQQITGGTLGAYIDMYLQGNRRTSPSQPDQNRLCFAGQSPACSIHGGAPFCDSPCLANATINFGLYPDSDLMAWRGALEGVGWFPLQRMRAHKRQSLSARLVTAIIPSSVGFHPAADWVEGVLWMNPKGARTGLHQDDEPCAVLHQLHGRKRITLYSPNQDRFLHPAASTVTTRHNLPCLFQCYHSVVLCICSTLCESMEHVTQH